MLGQLDTFDLEALMSDDPEFVGVFPLDGLPRGIDGRRTIKLIVNLEPRSLPGSHWVAIYRRDGKAFYFDTFGRLPPKDIHTWLSNNSRTWTNFDKTIQLANDKVSCGYICLEFLKKL